METKLISDADKLRIASKWLINEKHIQKDLNDIADRIDNLGIGNVPEREDLYLSKLIAILESLECENIPKLIKEGTEDQLREIGITIANFSKNRNQDKPFCFLSLDEFNLVEEAFQSFYQTELNNMEYLEGEDEKDCIRKLTQLEKLANKLKIKVQ